MKLPHITMILLMILIVSKNNSGREIKKERNEDGNFESIKSLADYNNKNGDNIIDANEKNELKNYKEKKKIKKQNALRIKTIDMNKLMGHYS